MSDDLDTWTAADEKATLERDERRMEYAEDLYLERQAKRRLGCLCGYPDWPGRCPGAAHCPVHGQDSGDDES